MEQIYEILISSGIIGMVFGVVTTKLINKRIDRMDAKMEKSRIDRQKENFLLMVKMDKSTKLSQMTAKKLHDKGIINGDLEQINNESMEADEQYDIHIKQLASEILRE